MQRVSPTINVPNGLPPVAEQPFFGLRPAGETPWITMEIENDPRRGPMCFAPLETAFLQGVGDSAAVDQHRAPHAGLSTRQRYLVHAQHGVRFLEPSAALASRLLAAPPDLSGEVLTLADEACGALTTTPERIAAVESFFREKLRGVATGRNERRASAAQAQCGACWAGLTVGCAAEGSCRDRGRKRWTRSPKRILRAHAEDEWAVSAAAWCAAYADQRYGRRTDSDLPSPP